MIEVVPEMRRLAFVLDPRHDAGMDIMQRTRAWARSVKRDVHALYLAARDPRVPWLAKAVAAGVAAYALSPIDLIPDFVPVIGYIDDLLIVPLGILLAVRLVPSELMAEHRAAAAAKADARPKSRVAAVLIVCVWIGPALAFAWISWNYVITAR